MIDQLQLDLTGSLSTALPSSTIETGTITYDALMALLKANIKAVRKTR